MTDAIAARIAELREHPRFGQWQDWAIEARATCDVEGHTERNCFGKCDRCAAHIEAPAKPVVMRPVEDTPAPCIHYSREDGCPMHGETCAPEYR